MGDTVVVADLDSLRTYVGAASTADDGLLAASLESATSWVYGRIYAESQPFNDVQQAILMIAARLYRRRNSTEGTAGFGGEGVVVRILNTDPDVNRLLERHLDMSCSETGLGIG